MYMIHAVAFPTLLLAHNYVYQLYFGWSRRGIKICLGAILYFLLFKKCLPLRPSKVNSLFIFYFEICMREGGHYSLLNLSYQAH